MVQGGKTPVQSAQELGQRGFRIVIFPGGTARSMVHTAPFKERMLDFDGLNVLIGTPELMEQGAQARIASDKPARCFWQLAKGFQREP